MNLSVNLNIMNDLEGNATTTHLKNMNDKKSPNTDVTVKKEARSRSSAKKAGLSNFINKLRPNSKGESLLHRAIIKGDVDLTKEYLHANISPNIRDHAGWTPLHEAALRGYCEVIYLIILFSSRH